jgi:HAD superfamily hydrolase (TIGR01509 family)
MMPRCRAVLFDFDGTLTRPDALDFTGIRAEIGCPAGAPILEFIAALPAEEEQENARRTLERFELAAARASVPNEGAEALVRLLRDEGIAVGILTRNSMSSVQEALKSFHAISAGDFAVIVTRESGARVKPHPDGVLHAAQAFGVKPREMLVVGDFVFDIAAGHAAGCPTVLLTNGQSGPHARGPGHAVKAKPDHTIEKLAELREILGL